MNGGKWKKRGRVFFQGSYFSHSFPCTDRTKILRPLNRNRKIKKKQKKNEGEIKQKKKLKKGVVDL
jgi:hypothetical protein